MHKRDTCHLPHLSPAVYPVDTSRPLSAILRRTLTQEFTACKRYEKGMIKDDDPEFLHQFRVILRRMRALLALHQPLFFTDATTALKTALQSMMQHTSHQRDLDVYLMKMDHYFGLVDHAHHLGLARFFDDLQRQRQQTQKIHKRWLKSHGYTQHNHDIAQHIQQLAPVTTPEETPLVFINRRLLTLQQKIITCSQAIDVNSEDSDLHRLRIKCKKLRYALAYYAPLHADLTLTYDLSTMKKIQTMLGDFNDNAVQIAFLTTYLSQCKPTGKRAKAVALLLNTMQQQHILYKRQLTIQIQHLHGVTANH